jgi:NADPH-dependent glutamate synthase beta subunit-like oxidoreductase
VFEALSKPGGMMRVGIPDYRLPKDVLDAEIKVIEQAGVEIKLNSRIESLDSLFEQGYDAVFLAIGAHRGTTMRIEGEDSPGVMDGAAFLRKVGLGEKVTLGDKVAVVGGGNVAIDGARVALRLGAKDVRIIYRRTRDEMPASPEEVEAALEEGINMDFLTNPVSISQEDGKLGVKCIRMALGEPDASGRRRPVPIEGSEFTVELDTLIMAIGQVSDIPAGFKVKTSRGNTIQVDEVTQATSRKGVWAGGDVATGPDSVIRAIAAGRRAASSIDKYLGGDGNIDEELTTERQIGMCVGGEEGFADEPRVKMPCLEVKQRLGNFSEVELGLDEPRAVAEGRRCFQCGIRLQIPAAPLAPAGLWSKTKGKKLESEKIPAV